MKVSKKLIFPNLFVLSLFLGSGATSTAFAASAFTNIGSIRNTVHNLTQDTLYVSLGNAVNPMQTRRNDYGEVCVYCHTPHGANRTVAAPLWNRTIKATNYQTYDELGTTTLTQTVSSTPGAASLTCLSCHDGQTAVDSIINMPSTQVLTSPVSGTKHGNGLITQESTQSGSFLNSWTNTQGGDAQVHFGFNSVQFGGTYVLGTGAQAGKIGCMSCHSPVTVDLSTAFVTGGNTDFNMAWLGTDLRNDHPVGITFPMNGSVDFNTPSGVQGSSQYFENADSLNGRMDKAEIRLYEGKVECASCHDPHGVPSGGPGSNTVFNSTFLRKQNTDGSKVCLTCHNK